MAADGLSPILPYLDSLVNAEFEPVSSLPSEKNFFSKHFTKLTAEKDETSGGDSSTEFVNLLKKIKSLANIENADQKQRQQSVAFFTPFVDKHWELARVYSVIRKRIRDELHTNTEIDKDKFVTKLQTAMALAALLETVHAECLNVPREKQRFLRDQAQYKELLQECEVKFDFELEDFRKVQRSIYRTQDVRNYHAYLNPFRLLGLRTRQVSFRTVPFTSQFPDYQQGLNLVENNFTFLFFTNLAWIFFLPRLLVNAGLIYKHVFDKSQMTALELELGWQTRLKAQLVRRWVELANDVAWFSSGLTTCFFLGAQLPIIGPYLGLAMQGYDLIISGTRAWIEIERFKEIEKYYRTCDPSPEMEEFLSDFRERVRLEQAFLAFNFINFAILLCCVCATLPPVVAINPIIPLIAAIVTVLITIANYLVNRYIDYLRAERYEQASVLPEYDLLVKTYADKNISVEELERILSEEKLNKPVLVLYADNYYVYGQSSDERWVLTHLDEQKVKSIIESDVETNFMLSKLSIDEFIQLQTLLEKNEDAALSKIKGAKKDNYQHVGFTAKQVESIQQNLEIFPRGLREKLVFDMQELKEIRSPQSRNICKHIALYGGHSLFIPAKRHPSLERDRSVNWLNALG